MAIGVADLRWNGRVASVTRRRVWVALVVVAVTGLLTTTVHASVRAGGPASRLQAPPHGELWIGTAATGGALGQIDPDVARLFLAGPASVTLGGDGGAITAMAWASEATFEADLAEGRIPPEVRVVLYDPEGWRATPLSERLDPAPAMRAFGELARSHGYLAVITPHPSLATVPGAVCVAEDGESVWSAYLRCGIQADAARYADVVEVQGQLLETDADAYRAFTVEAVRQARAANPSVTVLSGISTNFTDDPAVMYAAWRSVVGVVDGHYLNVPGGVRPHVAVDFLRMVAATRG